MFPNVRSINICNSVSIIAYENLRQVIFFDYLMGEKLAAITILFSILKGGLAFDFVPSYGTEFFSNLSSML